MGVRLSLRPTASTVSINTARRSSAPRPLNSPTLPPKGQHVGALGYHVLRQASDRLAVDRVIRCLRGNCHGADPRQRSLRPTYSFRPGGRTGCSFWQHRKQARRSSGGMTVHSSVACSRVRESSTGLSTGRLLECFRPVGERDREVVVLRALIHSPLSPCRLQCRPTRISSKPTATAGKRDTNEVINLVFGSSV